MKLDRDACYRALRTRDARFDGRIFIGVRTTGIYCRPICPARTPKLENIDFYPSAAAAQEAGFRPCLRCRPESSPDLAAWRGTSSTVSRALALIAEGALDGDEADVEGSGAPARHRRAAAPAALPAAPRRVADRGRADAARAVRQAADPRDADEHGRGRRGGRLRQRAAIQRDVPGPLSGGRRRRSGALSTSGAAGRDPAAAITLKLSYAPPYDWAAMIAFLAGARDRRASRSSRPSRYRRTIALDGAHGTIEVAPIARTRRAWRRRSASRTCARCRRSSRASGASSISAPTSRAITRAARRGSAPGARWSRPGPGCACRAPGTASSSRCAPMLGQQITVAAARRLAGKLVAAYGEPLATAATTEDGWPDGGLPASRAPGQRRTSRRSACRARAPRRWRRWRAAAAADPRLFDREHDLDGAVARLRALPGHRRVDGAVHRDARAARARCVSGRRHRPLARHGRRRRHAADTGGAARAAPKPGGRGAPTRRSISGRRIPAQRSRRPRGARGGRGMRAESSLHRSRRRRRSGRLLVWDDDAVLRALDFEGLRARACSVSLQRHYGAVEPEPGERPPPSAEPLAAFFAGELDAIEAIEVRTDGTEFQRRVWAALRAFRPGPRRPTARWPPRSDAPTRAAPSGSPTARIPIRDRRAVSSRHRRRRLAHRLRRRARAQALAAGARAALDARTRGGSSHESIRSGRPSRRFAPCTHRERSWCCRTRGTPAAPASSRRAAPKPSRRRARASPGRAAIPTVTRFRRASSPPRWRASRASCRCR